jgi:GT2 family glycosyltransferase
MTTIIVPSRFNDIFQDCLASINKFAPEEKKILVRDGEDIAPPAGWTVIQGIRPFVYSRNINLALNACTGDVLLMNDDCNFVNPGTVEAMEKIFDTYPDIGILSPKIIGGVGNADQSGVTESVRYTRTRICFICSLIRRSVIDKIGLLDERFTGYGYDDDDYCRRATDAGFKMAVTADAIVKHGHGKEKWSSSFQRIKKDDSINKRLYDAKWGTLSHRVYANAPYDKTGLVQDWWSRHSR